MRALADIRLQTQPTPVSCVHTCLAMGAGVLARRIPTDLGHDLNEPLSHRELLAGWEHYGVPYAELKTTRLVLPGWYFLTVPSLNERGHSHAILVRYDPDAVQIFTVLDPCARAAYKPDGSDLQCWFQPVLFHPRYLDATLRGD